MITPLDIQNKEFTKGVRGYKEDEVDGFLDLVTLDYDKLVKENKELKDRITELNREMESMKGSEASIYTTLDKAKELMNDISASAEKRAEMLLKNAEIDAKRIQKEALESVERLNQEAISLNQRIDFFKERYKNMLENELNRLDDASLGFFIDQEEIRMDGSKDTKESTRANL